MPSSYTVELSETAEAVYVRMAEDAQSCIAAGDESNSKVTQFRMVDEALDKIIPHDPLSPERALSGPLSGLYRVKKGRLRICYAANSKNHRIVVLYISDTVRKAGDVKDPYKILTKLVASGKFDALLKQIRLPLKLRPPERSQERTIH